MRKVEGVARARAVTGARVRVTEAHHLAVHAALRMPYQPGQLVAGGDEGAGRRACVRLVVIGVEGQDSIVIGVRA